MAKNKKHYIAISLTIIALGTAACGGSPRPSVSTDAETTAAGENTISGTVTGGTEHSINIKTDDGTELEFYVGDDTEKAYEDGYLIDRKIQITYSGQIDETGAQSTKALKIIDLK